MRLLRVVVESYPEILLLVNTRAKRGKGSQSQRLLPVNLLLRVYKPKPSSINDMSGSRMTAPKRITHNNRNSKERLLCRLRRTLPSSRKCREYVSLYRDSGSLGETYICEQIRQLCVADLLKYTALWSLDINE